MVALCCLLMADVLRSYMAAGMMELIITLCALFTRSGIKCDLICHYTVCMVLFFVCTIFASLQLLVLKFFLVTKPWCSDRIFLLAGQHEVVEWVSLDFQL